MQAKTGLRCVSRSVGPNSVSIKDGATPALGSPAPEFVLPDVHGASVGTADVRGAPALVVFFPFAFTGICSNELSELRDNLSHFEAAGVRVIAVSCDPIPALKAWDERENFGFDLLSDFWPHGEVAQAFGVFDEAAGRAQRGSFLLDAQGVLRWSVVNEPGQARPIADYLEAITTLST